MPTAIAYGASDRLLRTLLIVSVALLAVSLLAAMVAGRWIAGPIERLARRARDVAEGRTPSDQPATVPREVAIASRRFDEMVVALRASELLLSHALDAAGMGAWALDLASGRISRSDQHDRIFGLEEPLTDWTFETSIGYVVPDDRARVRDEFARASETGRLQFECRIAWADGSEHWIRVEGAVEHGAAGEPVRIVGTVADITARVRGEAERGELEDALRQSQKMEAVGQLAGGVAHDFNNLLMVIGGYCGFALSRLDGADPRLRGDIEEIARAADRAAQLTRQLLAFSRRQTLQPTVFELNAVVLEAETLLRRLLGEHIDIHSSLTEERCTVEADRGQVEQILMNLAVNARDAMPAGGTLTIETETLRLDEGEPDARFDALPGDYVLLRIRDTGSGMDAATREHAFEPFFTTKAPGVGTGLGLATVFGSVSQNGGYVALESEPGEGATFEILLPLVAAPAASVDAPAAREPVTGSERILLVEDDAVVRRLVGAILTGNGYDVQAASDGAEAWARFADRPFDLLLTDLVMPKVSGKELARRLRTARPALPVVFMSGYAYDVAGGELDAGDAFVQKPFSAHELGEIVRATLDEAAAALPA